MIFNRYKRDDIWDKSKKRFADVYAYSDTVADFALKHFFISHKSFCDNAISESRKIDEETYLYPCCFCWLLFRQWHKAFLNNMNVF